MPVKELQIKLSAKDEASREFDRAGKSFDQLMNRLNKPGGGFLSGLGASAKAANLEARQSGEVALERLIKGGGALAMYSYAAESISKISEATSEWSVANLKGEATWGELTDKVASSIPIFNMSYEAGRKLKFAIEDISAVIAKRAFGASDATTERMMSDNAFLKLTKDRAATMEQMDKVTQKALRVDERERSPNAERQRIEARDAFNEEIRSLRDQYKELEKLGEDQQPGQHRQLQGAEAAARHTLNERLKHIDAAAQLDQQEQTREHIRRIADIETDGEVKRLESAGRAADAQKLLLRKSFEDIGADARARERRQELDASNDPEKLKTIRARADSERTAREGAFKGALKGIDRDEQERVANELIRERISLLEEEAKYGKEIDRAELERLKTLEQFEPRRLALKKIAEDESASEIQRTRARRLLERTTKLEHQQLETPYSESAAPTTAALEEGRFLTGVRGSFDPIAEASKTTAANTTSMTTVLKNILDAIVKAQSAPRPIFNGRR